MSKPKLTIWELLGGAKYFSVPTVKQISTVKGWCKCQNMVKMLDCYRMPLNESYRRTVKSLYEVRKSEIDYSSVMVFR